MSSIAPARRHTTGRRAAARTKPASRVFTAAEFFAGIGLVRLALESTKQWRVVFANDIDEDKATMYRDNWPTDDHLVVGDIHKLDPAAIPTCDLFTASFPCNDLSIAGKWAGLNGKESSAFWGLIEILRALVEPKLQVSILIQIHTAHQTQSHAGEAGAEARS